MKLDRWAFALFALGVAADHRGHLLVALRLWRGRADGGQQGPPAQQQLCLLRLMGGALQPAQRGPCQEGHDGLFAARLLGGRHHDPGKFRAATLAAPAGRGLGAPPAAACCSRSTGSAPSSASSSPGRSCFSPSPSAMRCSRAMCWAAPTDWAFDASYILYGVLFIMAGAYALSRNAPCAGRLPLSRLAAAAAGGDGPRALLPVLLPRHHRLHLFGLWLCGPVMVHP